MDSQKARGYAVFTLLKKGVLNLSLPSHFLTTVYPVIILFLGTASHCKLSPFGAKKPLIRGLLFYTNIGVPSWSERWTIFSFVGLWSGLVRRIYHTNTAIVNTVIMATTVIVKGFFTLCSLVTFNANISISIPSNWFVTTFGT